MKKIFLLFIFFFLFTINVKAEDTVSIRKEETLMFSTKTTADGKRFNTRLYYLYAGEQIVYCIEPGVDVKDIGYASTTDFSSIGISDALKSELELIAYYGYSYDKHQHLYYYMAAQELIWEKMGATDIVWNTGSTYWTDMTSYKQEILDLIKTHRTLPSFANQAFTFKLGDENRLIDNNSVLSRFESDSIKSTDGNSLIFKSDVEKEEEFRFSHKYAGESSLLYYAVASQKVALLRISSMNTDSFFVKVRYEKEKGNIVVIKKDGKTEQLLKGAEFGLYDEKHKPVFMQTTKEDGTLVFENIPYGIYYIKEEKAPKGYIELDEEIKIDLKQSKKEIGITNQLYEMPITSNIDKAVIEKIILCLGGGLVFIYVSSKMSSL